MQVEFVAGMFLGKREKVSNARITHFVWFVKTSIKQAFCLVVYPFFTIEYQTFPYNNNMKITNKVTPKYTNFIFSTLQCINVGKNFDRSWGVFMKVNRIPLNNKTSKVKQRIKGSLVNFICEARSVSKHVLIMVTCNTAHSHSTGPGRGTGPRMIGLYIMLCTVHTTPRQGQGQRTGTGTNGLHTHFSFPSPVPSPMQCEQAVMAHSHCTGPGQGQGPGNYGFLYYAMYCTHYTGTETGPGPVQCV